MMFTASDVASVAESLSRWERGEYISEGFVVVACAGELVADFGRKCLTRAHRNRVERLSTILLVVALLASLICLERANVLSGRLIGSIRDKAVEAATKAEKALSDSTTALTQSGQANEKASAAEDASARAQSSADKAGVAAGKAQRIADEENKKRLELEAILAPRTLTIGKARPPRGDINAVGAFKGVKFIVQAMYEAEARRAGREIIIALNTCNWIDLSNQSPLDLWAPVWSPTFISTVSQRGRSIHGSSGGAEGIPKRQWLD